MSIAQALQAAIEKPGTDLLRIAPIPGFQHLPTIQQPHVVAEELIQVIRAQIDGHARSNQKALGPSELGHPCPRWLLQRLDGRREPRGGIPWKATVGTAIHSWLEGAFDHDNAAREANGLDNRWLTENRLMVGRLLGDPIWTHGETPADGTITGSCDLYDTETDGVWDWKTSDTRKVTSYRLHGIKVQYRIQAHLYGRGWELAGRTPRYVANAYLMRDGELRDTWVWAEPYDRQVALDAIARLEALELQRRLLGVEAALALYPLCDEEFCRFCQAEKPYQPTTLKAKLAVAR